MKQLLKNSDFRQPSSNQMKKSENQGRAIENNNGTRSRNENKTPSPLQNKSNQKQCNAPGKKKPPQSQ